MVARKTNNRFKSVQERLLPYITDIGKQQDMLVDIGEELSNMRNNISKDSMDEVKHQLKLQRVEHMLSLISLTYIMVGYDTERLSMLGMVKDEHKAQCFDVSREYMENTYKLMSLNHVYMESLSESLEGEDIKKLVDKSQEVIKVVYPLYGECLNLLKDKGYKSRLRYTGRSFCSF